MVISPEDQPRVIALARRALEARVRHTALPDVDSTVAPDVDCGAFVSIFHDGELRGCLGRLNSPLPLAQLVAELAQVVADSDPRFDPVTPQELAGISLEISILTPEREIQSVDDIQVGKHGLIVEQGFSRGLLLPQVADEHGWDREVFLDHACIKAGLAPDAWRHGARVLVFEAQVFGDRSSG